MPGNALPNDQKKVAGPDTLIHHIQISLSRYGLNNGLGHSGLSRTFRPSAVLLPLSQVCCGTAANSDEICLIFNKRSEKVRQPGDLCYPGGSLSALDKILAALLHLPGTALHKWPFWKQWRRNHSTRARQLSVLLAACLREAWEEMRLSPWQIIFLGPLPAQQLVLFKRRIFPFVCWTGRYQRLKPNWEVARIVPIALNRLLDPEAYGRYRIAFKGPNETMPQKKDYPCFLHRDDHADEILWGATFRITMDFLKIVFDFEPPAMNRLPVIKGRLDHSYLTGSQLNAP